MQYLLRASFFLLFLTRFASASDGYPSQQEIRQKIEMLAAQFPFNAHVIVIGKSVMGREIFGLKISSRKNTVTTRPRMALIGGIHGDEIVGRELLVSFAQDLLVSYGKNPAIKHLIDQSEIYIFPCLNPDGCDMKLRTNSQGVDLNREFPDLTTSDSDNSPEGRAPEVQAWMKFEATYPLCLSLTFHGGEIPTVNYPWDSIPQAFPQEALARELSLAYALKNPSMRDNARFPGGIANGYDWYSINGGMQDWAYYYQHNLQLTIETTLLERPTYASVYQHYLDNRQSLFSYVQKIFQGFGLVNLPHQRAEILIYSLRPVRVLNESISYNGNGEFYKVLLAGDYEVEVNFVQGISKSYKVHVFSDGSENEFIDWSK